MAEQYTNDAATTLNGVVAAGDATITVNSTTGFPTTGNFRIRIDNEILLVTNISGTLWSVNRAVEAASGVQTAAAHANNAAITQDFSNTIQLELNRAIYMDERRRERSARFAQVATDFAVLAEALAAVPLDDLGPFQAAAE